MNKYGFGRQLSIGKIGEAAVEKYLTGTYDYINDVRNEKSAQKIDIDYIVESNGNKYKIEVKTDTYYRTGNYFFETISNTTTGTEGCFLKSGADYWYYLFVPEMELHIIDIKVARKWFIKNMADFKKVELGTKTKNGYYKTIGYKVPRTAVPGIQIRKLD